MMREIGLSTVYRIIGASGILFVILGTGCSTSGDTGSSDVGDVPADTRPVPDESCLPGIPCVVNSDCPSGNHCNRAMQPPACQLLYCGGLQSACSEHELCLSQRCSVHGCEPKCAGLECGPDPIYGASCGTCPGSGVCESGQCICSPQDHKGCCDSNICWLDSCGGNGTIVESCPHTCANGKCVDCAALDQVDCSGTCRVLGTNSDCSRCGETCQNGGSCQAGECQCLPNFAGATCDRCSNSADSLPSCSGELPEVDRVTGSPCELDSQCWTLSCLTTEFLQLLNPNLEAPGGMCSMIGCSTDEECGPGSKCADANAVSAGFPMLCVRVCAVDSDCGRDDGYGCPDLGVKGTTGAKLQGCLPLKLVELLVCDNGKCINEPKDPYCPETCPK